MCVCVFLYDEDCFRCLPVMCITTHMCDTDVDWVTMEVNYNPNTQCMLNFQLEASETNFLLGND